MKVRIRVTFRDKYTGKVYKKGTEADFKKERISEILEVGDLITVIEKADAKKTGKKTEKKD